MNAPWSVESRTKVAELAVRFFNPINFVKNCETIGKTPKETHEVFSVTDFMTYLDRMSAFPKKPSVIRVIQILHRMSSTGLLQNLGNRLGEARYFADCYLFLDTYSMTPRGRGVLWLSPALGPEFLFRMSAPGVVQITGRNRQGDVRAGTGLVIHPYHILTCRHVVCDVEIDARQNFQGVECVVDDQSVHAHGTDDVAVIRVDKQVEPLEGAVFQTPIVGQSVYTLGYPRVPMARDPVLAMQGGAVTSESMVKTSGEELFLYSAISRPGNSGGPILTEDGYVVGISSRSLTMSGDQESDSPFSPHYAGVPSQVIMKAVSDMELDFEIPFEALE